MAILSPQQIAQLAYNAGFRGNALNIAVEIALAESGGNTAAYNPEDAAGTPQGSGSRGLWQIYGVAHPEFNNSQAFDPQTNAFAAMKVFREAGNRFTPWSTYNLGMGKPRQNYAALIKGVSQVTPQQTSQKIKTSAAPRPANTGKPNGLASQLVASVGASYAPVSTKTNTGIEGIASQLIKSAPEVGANIGVVYLGSLLIVLSLIALLFIGWASANMATGKFIAKNASEILPAVAKAAI